MSRDEQEKSIGTQRAALQKFAKDKGYKIIAEYIDEGISGDETEKRWQFQQMIADCTTKRFDLVLAWDQDRFGRFDPLEAGYWIKPMRDAGVSLETIAQGRIDWNDFSGRLVWSVTQEAKHAFLRDIARNTLRGNINRAKGGLTVGPAPFGYSRDQDGRYILGPEQDVEAVQRAFELRALGIGYRQIANRMNEERRPSPTGIWSKDAVRVVILREAYTGTYVFGQRNCGKYQTAIDGVVVQQTSTIKLNRSPIRVPNAHPAIVSPEQWAAVQRFRSEPPKRRAPPGESAAPLAGLLVCECGAPMYAQSMKSRQVKPNYICSRYHKGTGCGYRVVSLEVAHAELTRILQQTSDDDAELLKAIRKKLADMPKRDTKGQRSRIAQLDKRISTATDRILSVDQRLVADLERRILSMKDERETLVAELRVCETAPTLTAELILQKLHQLNRVFEQHDPAFIRASLKAIFSRAVASFSIGKKTKRGQGFRFEGITLFDQSSNECASSWSNTPFWTSILGRIA